MSVDATANPKPAMPVTPANPAKPVKIARLRELMPQIWVFVRPRRWLLLAGFGLMAVNRVAGLVLPASSKYLIDNIIGKRRIEMLLPLVAVVVGATVVQGITDFSLT